MKHCKNCGNIVKNPSHGYPPNYFCLHCDGITNAREDVEEIKEKKYCKKCEIFKNIEEFSKDKSHSDGYSSQCKNCRNKYHRDRKEHYTLLKKEWRKNNPNKNKQTLKKFYYSHKEEISLQRKILRKLNLNKIRNDENNWRYKKRYGISIEEKNEILLSQKGKCALCKKEISGFSAVTDHDHKTGKVRGILCRTCNFGLGILGDSLESIQLVVEYLKNGA